MLRGTCEPARGLHRVRPLTGQNKPSALEKVERLEKLESIGVSRLQMQTSKLPEMERRH